MKRLLLILILTFSFQTLAKADDLSDFEIEGMSIGDSVLDFFSKDEILNSPKSNAYKNNDYITATFLRDIDKSDSYDEVTLSYKSNDKKYTIVGASGVLYFKNNHLKCYKKQDKIINEIKVLFPNDEIIKVTNKLRGLTDGSNTKQAYLKLTNGFIGVQCKKFGIDAKKKWNSINNLKVDIFTTRYNDWLINVAYK